MVYYIFTWNDFKAAIPGKQEMLTEGYRNMKRMLFIYNPKAGKGMIRNKLSYILEEFGKGIYEIVVHPTREPEEAIRVVAEYGGSFDMIACSGGDGTLNEVITGLKRGNWTTPVGYIPAGSTNDFGSSLGIPKEMQEAARSIMTGTVFDCDLGQLNDGYFVYVAAFGVFTEVSYKTSQDSKNMLGHLAYILEGMKSLGNIQNWSMRFLSEQVSGEGKFLYGMITNSNSVGGFKGITGQDVTLNDGEFEVTLIEDPENIIEWPGIINALLNGEKNKYVIAFKSSRVEFFFDEKVPWTRDGEYGGSYEHAVVINLPKALPIIV